METALDISRWGAKPLGLAYRRWVIASTGLRQILGTRFFRFMMFLAWTTGVAVAVVGFLFSQTIVSGGWLEDLGASFGPRPQAVAAAFCAFVLLYPDIIIEGLFTLIFWWQAHVGLGLSLVALTVVVPRLVARDRASNALTIYLSRPLTSFDYLVGKFGIVVGLLLILWTGPLVLGFVLSALAAPDSVFVVYSVAPFLRALLFNLIGLVTLAAIAMGVSSIAKSSANTILLWIGCWVLAGFVARFPGMPGFIRYASFSYDLDQVSQALFSPGDKLVRAGESLPVFSAEFTEAMTRIGQQFQSFDSVGAAIGLAVLIGASCAVFFVRLRPR